MGAGGGRHGRRTPRSRTAAPGPRARAAAPSGLPSVPWSRRPCLETQGPDRGHAKVGQGVRVTSRFAWPREPGPQRLGERPTLLTALHREVGGRKASRRPPRHSPRCELHRRSRPSPSGRCCVPGDSAAGGKGAGLQCRVATSLGGPRRGSPRHAAGRERLGEALTPHLSAPHTARGHGVSPSPHCGHGHRAPPAHVHLATLAQHGGAGRWPLAAARCSAAGRPAPSAGALLERRLHSRAVRPWPQVGSGICTSSTQFEF